MSEENNKPFFPDLLRDDKFTKRRPLNRTVSHVPAPAKQKKSVLLPTETHQRLKRIAAQEDLFIMDVVAIALDDFEKKLAKRDALIAKREQEWRNERP